jgi:hypothetical protein
MTCLILADNFKKRKIKEKRLLINLKKIKKEEKQTKTIYLRMRREGMLDFFCE